MENFEAGSDLTVMGMLFSSNDGKKPQLVAIFPGVGSVNKVKECLISSQHIVFIHGLIDPFRVKPFATFLEGSCMSLVPLASYTTRSRE